MDDADRFLQAWHERAAPLLDEALIFLAGLEQSPFADGVLGDWVDQVRGFRFAERHTQPIVALVNKDDPFLQEAGLRLAASAMDQVDGLGEALELPLAELLQREPVDPWVLRAVARLLGNLIGPQDPPMTAAYRELVRIVEPEELEPMPEDARQIMRNMFINPRRELIELFEQIALQTMSPGERELALLPVLEDKHETKGWQATVSCLLERMGLDPEEHFALLDE